MFRISLLLWLVAIAALNLVFLKYSESVIDLSPKFAGIIGLMPLFDLFVLSLYLALTRRFRFALVRRTVRKNIIDSAAIVSGAILVLGTASCLLFPEVVLQLVNLLFSPVDQWIRYRNHRPNKGLPHRGVPWTAHVRAADPLDVRPRLHPQPVQARNHAARGHITATLAWRRRNKEAPPAICRSQGLGTSDFTEGFHLGRNRCPAGIGVGRNRCPAGIGVDSSFRIVLREWTTGVGGPASTARNRCSASRFRLGVATDASVVPPMAMPLRDLAARRVPDRRARDPGEG